MLGLGARLLLIPPSLPELNVKPTEGAAERYLFRPREGITRLKPDGSGMD